MKCDYCKMPLHPDDAAVLYSPPVLTVRVPYAICSKCWAYLLSGIGVGS